MRWYRVSYLSSNGKHEHYDIMASSSADASVQVLRACNAQEILGVKLL